MDKKNVSPDNLSIDEMLQLIGTQAVQIVMLRKQIVALTSVLAAQKPEEKDAGAAKRKGN